MLDGKDTTLDEVADKALAVVGGKGEIKVSFLTKEEILIHLRQKYVAARGGSGTQIAFGYTLVPKALQAVTGPADRLNPLRTQHQFLFTITRQHHPNDSPGLESSFQGSVAINDKGEIVNVQAGGQEAVVLPLLKGWIQISGFVQTMAAANWGKAATGQVSLTPSIQTGAGGQALLTPAPRGGPFRFLTGHLQLGVQATAGVQASPQGVQAGANVGFVLNIPISL